MISIKNYLNDSNVYEAVFTIDDYKQAYIKCWQRNDFVQKSPYISKDEKRNFNRKSMRLQNMLKRIVYKSFETIEDYMALTQACSIVHGELIDTMLRFKKIPAFKKSKDFEIHLNISETVLDILNGKNAFELWMVRHPFLYIILLGCFFIASLLLCSLFLQPEYQNVFVAVGWCILVVAEYLMYKNMDWLSLKSKAAKAKRYKYLDQGAYNKFMKSAKDVAEHIHFK